MRSNNEHRTSVGSRITDQGGVMMTNTRISAALLLALFLVQAGSAQQPPQEQQPARAEPKAQDPPKPKAQDPQPAPGKQPTFRAGINFVRVDVIVSDKKGA